MQWYYADNGRQAGPVSELELDRLRQSGTVRDDTLVWRSGMTDWQPYSAAVGARGPAFAAPPPPPSPLSAEPAPAAPGAGGLQCSQCGGVFAADDLLRYGNDAVCAACKPAYFQRLREGADVRQRIYAGFWIRFVATFIDGVLLGIAQLALVFGVFVPAGLWEIEDFAAPDNMGRWVFLQLTSTLISVVINWLYEAFFTSRHGGTPGKLLLKLQVIREDGSRLSFAHASGRHFAKYLSHFTCMVGYIMAGFDAEKRALHDYVASTRVVVR